MGAPASEWGGRAAGRAHAWENQPQFRWQRAGGRGSADRTRCTGCRAQSPGSGKNRKCGDLLRRCARLWQGEGGLEVLREAPGTRSREWWERSRQRPRDETQSCLSETQREDWTLTPPRSRPARCGVRGAGSRPGGAAANPRSGPSGTHTS